MFLRATVTAAALITAAVGFASPAQSDPDPCYIAKSGDCVPYPRQGGHSRQMPLPNV